jgi:hypothetical protein
LIAGDQSKVVSSAVVTPPNSKVQPTAMIQIEMVFVVINTSPLSFPHDPFSAAEVARPPDHSGFAADRRRLERRALAVAHPARYGLFRRFEPSDTGGNFVVGHHSVPNLYQPEKKTDLSPGLFLVDLDQLRLLRDYGIFCRQYLLVDRIQPFPRRDLGIERRDETFRLFEGIQRLDEPLVADVGRLFFDRTWKRRLTITS